MSLGGNWKRNTKPYSENPNYCEATEKTASGFSIAIDKRGKNIG